MNPHWCRPMHITFRHPSPAKVGFTSWYNRRMMGGASNHASCKGDQRKGGRKVFPWTMTAKRKWANWRICHHVSEWKCYKSWKAKYHNLVFLNLEDDGWVKQWHIHHSNRDFLLFGNTMPVQEASSRLKRQKTHQNDRKIRDFSWSVDTTLRQSWWRVGRLSCAMCSTQRKRHHVVPWFCLRESPASRGVRLLHVPDAWGLGRDWFCTRCRKGQETRGAKCCSKWQWRLCGQIPLRPLQQCNWSEELRYEGWFCGFEKVLNLKKFWKKKFVRKSFEKLIGSDLVLKTIKLGKNQVSK